MQPMPVPTDSACSHRRGRHHAVALAVAVAACWPAPAAAVVVGGGGSVRTDCLAVFDAPATIPSRRPRHVVCADGEACDMDGTVNGRCSFAISVCVNSTLDPRCELRGIDELRVRYAEDDGNPNFDPEFQALQARVDAAVEFPSTALDQCTLPSVVTVAVRGPFARGRCLKNRKTVKLTALSTVRPDGRSAVDDDKLRLTCEPAPAGCDPRALYAGTFDRIQTQVFDQSCALSGCHDSQSKAAEMLLEPGGALPSLVDQVPTNGAAAAAGWKRVTPGNPDASLLVRKVADDLGPGLGGRMPLGRPALDRRLVDVITAWVAAGAPADGWVPGTDE